MQATLVVCNTSAPLDRAAFAISALWSSAMEFTTAAVVIYNSDVDGDEAGQRADHRRRYEQPKRNAEHLNPSTTLDDHRLRCTTRVLLTAHAGMTHCETSSLC